MNEGSPPRLRGEESPPANGDGGHRITPAPAGRSWRFNREAAVKEDHPRACGEKSVITASPCQILGSPPRLRGEGV